MHGLSSHILARENLLMTTCQPALPSEDPRLPACLQVPTSIVTSKVPSSFDFEAK